MQPMPNWPNGLVSYTEHDIRTRDFLIQEISSRLRAALKEINPAIDFIRVETPCLIPTDLVQQHIEAEFELWKIQDADLYLRPESTKSTYAMFPVLFPQVKQLRKRLPLCIWQSNLSFRAEQDKTFSNLRFKQFYQLEFQLAYAPDTKADYHQYAVHAMKVILLHLFNNIREECLTSDLPFYSQKTTDLYIDKWEVVAISSRTDFEYPVIEISCGLDRLTAIFNKDV